MVKNLGLRKRKIITRLIARRTGIEKAMIRFTELSASLPGKTGNVLFATHKRQVDTMVANSVNAMMFFTKLNLVGTGVLKMPDIILIDPSC